MALTGADVQALRNLGQQMGTKASEIQQIAQALNGQLQSVQWIGADADKFRNEWQSNHAQALSRVVEALQQGGQALQRNAQEQETASN